MKHTTLDQIGHVAAVHAGRPPSPPLSRTERLERWANLLERQPDRPLATLEGTEYLTKVTRMMLRCAQSPISVAFDDPVLRQAGMRNDTYGEAKRFFQLSDWQLHEIVCYCHFGGTMRADAAGRRVSRLSFRPTGTDEWRASARTGELARGAYWLRVQTQAGRPLVLAVRVVR